MANTNLSVSSLDFPGIRASLVSYLQGRSEFEGFDFSDTALSTLIDLLAYNTYYMSFYANMAANEAFLDTAQLYESVASRAKALGYRPTSAKGPTANVLVRFTSATANATFRSISINKNTRFRTSVNGVSYTFVTPKSYVVAANSTNGFQGYIDLVEGEPLTHEFTFTTANTSFVIPNANTDVSSITVTVTSSGNTQTYSEATDLTTANSSSKYFFVEADRNKLYKVGFGDGVLGQKPPLNSTVAVSYRACSAERANGANNFTAASAVGGQTAFSLRVVSRASGGAPAESIESIRFNAPRLYETQNRAVTTEDYKRIIIRDNPDLEAVSVWGGEDNDPPIYGKVYVAAKPLRGTLLSTNRKTAIKSSLRRYNVQSIDVEMTDPAYLYVVPYVEVRYVPEQTTRTASEIAAALAARVRSFESAYLGKFESKFRLSKFLAYLDDVDDAVTGSRAVIDLQKRFSPSTTSKNDYVIRFNTHLLQLGEGEQLAAVRGGSSAHPGFGWLTSSSFTKDGFTSYLEDNGFGIVRTYYRSSVGRFDRVYTDRGVGTVDYTNGIVYLNAFKPDAVSGDALYVTARPVSQNVNAVRNQIILMAGSRIAVLNDSTGAVLATASDISTIGDTAIIAEVPGLTTF